MMINQDLNWICKNILNPVIRYVIIDYLFDSGGLCPLCRCCFAQTPPHQVRHDPRHPPGHGSGAQVAGWKIQERVWCKFSGCNLPPLAHDFFFFLFTNYPYFIYIFGKWMPFLGKNVFCRALPYQKNIFLKIISPNNRGCSVKTTVVCAELLKLLHTQCGCALSLLWVCWLDCCAADNTQPSPAKLNFSDKVTAATSNKCVN